MEIEQCEISSGFIPLQTYISYWESVVSSFLEATANIMDDEIYTVDNGGKVIISQLCPCGRGYAKGTTYSL